MKYSGMTVNERLYASGLIEKFDNAIKRRRYKKAVKILIEAELTTEQAQSTVEAIENRMNMSIDDNMRNEIKELFEEKLKRKLSKEEHDKVYRSRSLIAYESIIDYVKSIKTEHEAEEYMNEL